MQKLSDSEFPLTLQIKDAGISSATSSLNALTSSEKCMTKIEGKNTLIENAISEYST